MTDHTFIVAQSAVASTPTTNEWEVKISWEALDGRQYHGLPSTYIPAWSMDHAVAIAAAINSFAITMEIKP